MSSVCNIKWNIAFIQWPYITISCGLLIWLAFIELFCSLPCYRKASQFLYSWCCILEFILIASDRRKLSKEAAQYNLIYFNSVTQDKNNRKHRCVSCDNWNCVLIWIDTAEWVERTAEERTGCFATADSGEILDRFCVSGDFALFGIEQISTLKA